MSDDWGLDEPTVGSLVRRRGKWITLPPTHCPHGHWLGPGRVLVGHVACSGHGGGGHNLWHCRMCPVAEPPTFGPPLGRHCKSLEGPASVRISTGPEPEESQTVPEPPF